MSRSVMANVLVVAFGFSPSLAQDTVRIPDRPSCRSCTVELRHSIQLGSEDGPGIIEGLSITSVDSRGRFYVFRNNTATSISVFDPAGKYLTTIGTRGRGPGEYLFIPRVEITDGDTLHVFDYMNTRRTVLDSGYNVVRTHLLEVWRGLVQTIVRPDHSIVVAASVRTPESVGMPLHLLSRDGGLVQSFGSVGGWFRADRASMDERVISHSADGGIWSAHRRSYVIEKWDVPESMNKVIERTAPWFEAETTADRKAEVPRPPFARIQAVKESADGLLWVLLTVADPNWRDGLTTEGSHQTPSDHNTYYDTVIEVIDPRTGRLLASHRADLFFMNFVGEDHLGTTIFDSKGVPYVQLWSVELIQP